eukprot:gene6869-9129_t
MPKKKEGPAPAKQSLATLFDYLLEQHKLKNDAALARELKLPPPDISKARNGKRAIGASLILNLHETFGIPVTMIRDHMEKKPSEPVLPVQPGHVMAREHYQRMLAQHQAEQK